MEASAATNKKERKPLNAESVGRLRLGGTGGGGAASGCRASLGLCGVTLWPEYRRSGRGSPRLAGSGSGRSVSIRL